MRNGVVWAAVACWMMSARAGAEERTCRMETREHAGGPLLYETVYRADAAGRLAVEEVVVEGKVTMRTRYRRDGSHRVIEKCTFEVDGARERPDGCARLVYRGAATAPAEWDEVGADGKVAAHGSATYDARGREVGRRLTLARGGVKVEVRYYAADGRLARVETVDPQLGASTVRYRYSPAGELIEESL